MDQTHIHLLVTHLPVFGSVLGALVLAHGIISGSETTRLAAYNIFIICALAASVAYITGEAAEETVEHLPGVIEHNIEEHEEAALYALVSMILLGVASIAGHILRSKKSALSSSFARIILVFSLLSFVISARTGYLGGQIRHTEISNKNATLRVTEPEHEDHD